MSRPYDLSYSHLSVTALPDTSSLRCRVESWPEGLFVFGCVDSCEANALHETRWRDPHVDCVAVSHADDLPRVPIRQIVRLNASCHRRNHAGRRRRHRH
jgi:hypothetical protein